MEDQVIQIDTQTGEICCVLDLGEVFSDYKKNCTVDERGRTRLDAYQHHTSGLVTAGFY